MNINVILEETKRIIKEAGREVMEIYNQGFDVDTKDDDSPVTLADIHSDKIIIKGIEHFGYPILSEESIDNLDRLNNSGVWIVDSLDGTSDFIQKTGEFSIMVGLVQDGSPIIGLVYLPSKDKLYYAVKGEGSYLEEDGKTKKLKVTKINRIKESKLVVSRNHLKPEDKKRAEDMGIKNLKKSGSNGIKMGLIAEGQADIFYNTTNKMSQWDGCAPEIILTEAGGEVTDVQGRNIVYNTKNIKLEYGLVATNGLLHNILIKNLKV